VFCVEGTPGYPKSLTIVPICDNVVGWLGTVGVLVALRRRAEEGLGAARFIEAAMAGTVNVISNFEVSLVFLSAVVNTIRQEQSF
jgi:crotonobetainyl-CoA:carnitine CoA-transferase CaiB-like acyl-CoA transferase